ncbi:MAG: cytochrome c biogenesis protein CcsA, partial [Candidatus Contubernalis sp.]|nr:cytochrome c biogenesis protein CcsA [Candidatus Contubernalis sp.]
MIGTYAIYAAFFFALCAALIYGYTFFLQRDKFLPLARGAYYLKTIAVTAASSYLLWGLLTHQFKYFYVYYHSSTDLPLEYLISAFWAGQEGTFLLWVLLAAVFGLFIIRWEKEYESPVMFFLLVGQAFLLLFLLLYNPFRLMPGIPLEGVGLNPLLKDPWMVIHPPIIFVGYAALLLPCAYAFGGLWKKDYQGWASRALPWALTGWLFLGAGIIIGGYWAYRTLGWGGYWGWDPVENASLVPWLTCTALIHGILLQKARSLSYRSNLFFAYITFVLVIYATFLTRSGILADFSVHAFSETGLNPYMLAFMLFYFLVGTALLLFRWRDIPGIDPGENWYSKVSTFSYTAILLSLSAVLITLGTSSPILTGLLGEPASVDISFYNLTNAPIVVLLALVLAACPLLGWKDEDSAGIKRKLKGPLLFTLAGLIASIVLGVYSPLKLAFIGASLLALGTNFLVLLPAVKRGLKHSGGYLAHVGLALMFIGILTSSVLSHSHIISLQRGETVEVHDYHFTLITNTVVDEKEAFEIQVEKGGRTWTATPKIYLAGS